MVKALIEVYPDIGLDSLLFHSYRGFFSLPLSPLYLLHFSHLSALLFSTSGSDWRNKARRKQFFDDYAKTNGFDSNIADNWYTVSFARILSTKVRAKKLVKSINITKH